jgi:hypothetical protein
MGRYTFSMQGLIWILVLALAGGVAWAVWRARRRLEDQQRAEAARTAAFLAQALQRPRDGPAAAAPQERLLFDAAAKAGEAGEAALAFQLYARLVARFPQSALVAQARAAAESEKKKIATATAPGTSGRG